MKGVSMHPQFQSNAAMHEHLRDGDDSFRPDTIPRHVDLLDPVVVLEDRCQRPAPAVKQPVVVEPQNFNRSVVPQGLVAAGGQHRSHPKGAQASGVATSAMTQSPSAVSKFDEMSITRRHLETEKPCQSRTWHIANAHDKREATCCSPSVAP
eukprot:3935740-Rhodomonas_salina.2